MSPGLQPSPGFSCYLLRSPPSRQVSHPPMQTVPAKLPCNLPRPTLPAQHSKKTSRTFPLHHTLAPLSKAGVSLPAPLICIQGSLPPGGLVRLRSSLPTSFAYTLGGPSCALCCPAWTVFMCHGDSTWSAPCVEAGMQWGPGQCDNKQVPLGE